LRLLFVGVALVLRNVWVWLHATILKKSGGEHPELRLHLLRSRRLLDWRAFAATEQLHDRSPPSVAYN